MSNFEEEGIYSWRARYPVACFLLLLELVGFLDGVQIPQKLRIAKLMHEIVAIYTFLAGSARAGGSDSVDRLIRYGKYASSLQYHAFREDNHLTPKGWTPRPPRKKPARIAAPPMPRTPRRHVTLTRSLAQQMPHPPSPPPPPPPQQAPQLEPTPLQQTYTPPKTCLHRSSTPTTPPTGGYTIQ
ncbi:hypothetical protein C8J57DRAFT_1223674 [Mycena rebaudengoi]|nr:hypothetical protein C8J57DRAFT_1223674 [Mycena rebaudengoi]